MIIKKITLEGFGVFAQKKEISLSAGFNVISGNNEAGKSTIAGAIYVAFFESRRQVIEKYRSWSYSGKFYIELEIEVGSINFTIKRDLDENSIFIINSEGSNLFAQKNIRRVDFDNYRDFLKNELNISEADLYKFSTYVSQNEVQMFLSEDKIELIKPFIITEKNINHLDIIKILEDNYYRITKQSIGAGKNKTKNRQLEIIEEQLNELEEHKLESRSLLAEYNVLQGELAGKNAELEKVVAEGNLVRKKIELSREYKEKRAQAEMAEDKNSKALEEKRKIENLEGEIIALNDRIKTTYSAFTGFPPNADILLNDLAVVKSNIKIIKDDILDMETRIKTTEQEREELDKLLEHRYADYEKVSSSFEKDFVLYGEKKREYDTLMHELRALDKRYREVSAEIGAKYSAFAKIEGKVQDKVFELEALMAKKNRLLEDYKNRKEEIGKLNDIYRQNKELLDENLEFLKRNFAEKNIDPADSSLEREVSFYYLDNSKKEKNIEKLEILYDIMKKKRLKGMTISRISGIGIFLLSLLFLILFSGIWLPAVGLVFMLLFFFNPNYLFSNIYPGYVRSKKEFNTHIELVRENFREICESNKKYNFPVINKAFGNLAGADRKDFYDSMFLKETKTFFGRLQNMLRQMVDRFAENNDINYELKELSDKIKFHNIQEMRAKIVELDKKTDALWAEFGEEDGDIDRLNLRFEQFKICNKEKIGLEYAICEKVKSDNVSDRSHIQMLFSNLQEAAGRIKPFGERYEDESVLYDYKIYQELKHRLKDNVDKHMLLEKDRAALAEKASIELRNCRKIEDQIGISGDYDIRQIMEGYKNYKAIIEEIKSKEKVLSDNYNKEKTESEYFNYSSSLTLAQSGMDNFLKENEGLVLINIADLEQAEKDRNELRQKREALAAELKDLEQKVAFIKGKFENDEKLYNTDLIERQQRELQQEKERLQEKGEALKAAFDIINECVEEFRTNYVPVLTKKMEHYLKLITDSRYTGISLDEKYGISVNSSTKQGIEEDMLSYGTRDQLFFALRLAAADFILGQADFPFILDDPFVNCDEERLMGILNILLEIKKQRQILFFTHDKSMNDWGDKAVLL